MYWFLILSDTLKKKIMGHFELNFRDFDHEKDLFVRALLILQDYRNGLAHDDLISKISPEKSLRLSDIKALFGEDPSFITHDEFIYDQIGHKDLFALLIILFSLIPSAYKNYLKTSVQQRLQTFEAFLGNDALEIRRILNIPSKLLERVDYMSKKLKI
ncbi:hypothetical protein ACKP2L_05220 [Oenococcus alcoholitolerans]|uniref:hypothetical protein n=1 Tax=Oenococcus alcoholitolerans TaxID=931074 RepID=UPI003F70B373